MAQHRENDLAIPVLRLINSCKNGCTTEYIKRHIAEYMEMNEDDLSPFPSRPNEPRYYQVVGNLISHKNATLFKYIDIFLDDNSKKYYKINQLGLDYLINLDGGNIAEVECSPVKKVDDEITNNEIKANEEKDAQKNEDEEFVIVETDFEDFDIFDKKIMDFVLRKGLDSRPPTDSKLKDTVIELSGYKCEYAASIGKKHRLFKGKSKTPFLEGHHLIPMKASIDFFPRSLDRPSNIVSLCPVCHSLLHHALKEEKESVLRVIFDNHKEQLKKDGLYISFEKLLDKYYK